MKRSRLMSLVLHEPRLLGEPDGDIVPIVYHQVAFFDVRSPMARASRAAIYARYSSDLSRDASIEDQVRLCRQHADRLGWTVTEVFEDRAISGASAIRPGYQALLAAVAEGRIDIVLARRSTA
jgi:predicted site-specific integrase-resolvase